MRIWNDNTVAYKEEFGDKMVTILPGKFVDMEADEAVRFMGTYTAIQLDGMGNQKVESMKKLRREIIEPLFDDGSGNYLQKKTPASDEFKCTVCGKECMDQEHLDGHINAQHLDDMVDKKEQAKRMNQINKAKR